MKSLIAMLGLIAFVVLLIVIGPLATIWAWNTLFTGYPIAYSFDTWLAVVILGAFFRANVSIKKDK
jgi:hypothetical protein